MAPTIKTGDRKIKYLSQHQVSRFLNVVKAHNEYHYLIFATIYKFALRASEVGLLTTANLDLDSKTLFVRRVKNSVSRAYTIPPDLLKLLKTHLENRKDGEDSALFLTTKCVPIHRTWLYKLFRHYATLAHLPVTNVHCLRHSMAVAMVEAEIPILGISHFLGHKSITNTMVYARITPKAEEAIYEKMTTSQSVVKLDV